MFSKSIKHKLKNTFILLIISVLFGCEQESNIDFYEENILLNEPTVVEINIPIANGDQVICDSINKAVTNFVIQALNVDTIKDIKNIEESIVNFHTSFNNFKNNLSPDVQQDLTVWEASIEGEVIYQSHQLICIAMNKYLNTGGVHGTSKVSFLNFNSQTGESIHYETFVTDKEKLRKVLKSKFEKEIGPIAIEDFRLPETMGLNDEGIIILYNINEVPSYSDTLIEFTVPFDEIDQFLKIY